MPEKGKRGFAGMDQEKQRRIASLGGKAAHRKGTAHEFTPEEAREAGRKGGRAAHQKAAAHRLAPSEPQEVGMPGRGHTQNGESLSRILPPEMAEEGTLTPSGAELPRGVPENEELTRQSA